MSEAAATGKCDLVFRGGHIYTVNPQQPWAEAVAIGAGRFLHVGGNDDVAELIDEETEVVDLEGRLVIPAIYDTHVHLVTAVHYARDRCRLPEPASDPTLDDYLSAVEKAYREGEWRADGWLLGGVWSPFSIGSGWPRREMLDEIVGDTPAFLVDTTIHSAWVNSAALRVAGIDKNTPDPQFGMILRDTHTGEPTGCLIEYSAMALVGRHIPRLPLARRIELVERGIAELNSHGVVGFCEAASEEADLVALNRLARDGRLSARVLTRNIAVQAGSIEEDLPLAEDIASLAATYHTGRLDTGGAKIYVDGVPMNDTVAFLDRQIPFEMPYRYGDLTISPEKLSQVVSELDRRGLAIMMHCLGDKAVRVALDAVEAARTANPDGGLLHCITHGFIVSEQDIPRHSQLGVALSLQTWASPKF